MQGISNIYSLYALIIVLLIVVFNSPIFLQNDAHKKRPSNQHLSIMSQSEVTLDPAKLLHAIVENLNAHFYAANRDASKRVYQLLLEGKNFPFMRIEMGDVGEVLCELALDHSEHVGKINYSQFRKGLAVMMLGIKQRLDAQQSLNIMSSDDGELLFHIPGIHKSSEGVNVIVCGLRQTAPGMALVRLMYLNPESYAEAAMTAANTETKLQPKQS